MFSYYEKGYKSSQLTDTIDILSLVSMIKDPLKKEAIERMRQLPYKCKEYDGIKDGLPCITPHATFGERRKLDALERLSGYLFFDIDGLQDEAALKQMREHIIGTYGDLIVLLGTSVGGRGLFFYCKAKGLTIDNHSRTWTFLRDTVFADLNIDGNATGIARPHVVTYDPDVYFNSLAVPSESLATNVDPKNCKVDSSIRSEPVKKVEAVPLPDINEVLRVLKRETSVTVTAPVVEIKPVDYLRVYIPQNIPEGKRHKTYRAMVDGLVHLNPEAQLSHILSFINYVDQNHAAEPLHRKEMARTVGAAFERLKKTGEGNVRTRLKTVHFAEDCGLSADERRLVASSLNGLMRSMTSVAAIEKARLELEKENGRITQKALAHRSGLSEKTVQRHRDRSVEQIQKELLAICEMLNSRSWEQTEGIEEADRIGDRKDAA